MTIKRKRDLYEDGWYYGYSPERVLSDVNDEGATRYVERDTRNVVGRFKDIEVIDLEASKAAKRSCYKHAIGLETRIINAVEGRGSDTSITRIVFTNPYKNDSVRAIERFMSAWENYQDSRITPITEDEYYALDEVGIRVQKPQPKVAKTTKISGGRGGKRPGAGRPRKTAKK